MTQKADFRKPEKIRFAEPMKVRRECGWMPSLK
jgi:hypothetical protein